MECMKSGHISWMIYGILFLNFTYTYGLNACQTKVFNNVSLATELQSDILLPCSFESHLLNSGKTNETSVVWIHVTTTETYIVEISLDGSAKFWKNHRGRIKTISKSLDFSIHIYNVQESDLGVYQCRLFTETSCLLAYKIINLQTVDFPTWLIPAGAAGGAVALLVLLIIACTVFKRRTVGEVTHTSVIHQSQNFQESNVLVQDNIINSSSEDSAHVSSDTVLDAGIKKGHENKNTTSELKTEIKNETLSEKIDTD